MNGSTAIDCDIDGVPELVVSWDLTQTVLNDGYRFVGTAVVSDLRTSKDVAYKQDYRGHYDLAPDGRFTQASYINAKHTFEDYEQLGGGLWLLSGDVIAPLAANGCGRTVDCDTRTSPGRVYVHPRPGKPVTAYAS